MLMLSATCHRLLAAGVTASTDLEPTSRALAVKAPHLLLCRKLRHLKVQSLSRQMCRCSCKKSCQADTCCLISQSAHTLAQGKKQQAQSMECSVVRSTARCVCKGVCECANNDLRLNLLSQTVTCDSKPLFTL